MSHSGSITWEQALTQARTGLARALDDTREVFAAGWHLPDRVRARSSRIPTAVRFWERTFPAFAVLAVLAGPVAVLTTVRWLEPGNLPHPVAFFVTLLVVVVVVASCVGGLWVADRTRAYRHQALVPVEEAGRREVYRWWQREQALEALRGTEVARRAREQLIALATSTEALVRELAILKAEQAEASRNLRYVVNVDEIRSRQVEVVELLTEVTAWHIAAAIVFAPPVGRPHMQVVAPGELDAALAALTALAAERPN